MSIELIQQILEDHDRRLNYCEHSQEDLKNQFSNLVSVRVGNHSQSRLVNSSLLSGTSPVSISQVSSVHETSSSLTSWKDSVPLFADDHLPKMRHVAVELGHVEQWTPDMVDSVVSAVMTSLRVWLREKEQLLMLKRLLIRKNCRDGERGDEWYKRAIGELEVG